MVKEDMAVVGGSRKPVAVDMGRVVKVKMGHTVGIAAAADCALCEV